MKIVDENKMTIIRDYLEGASTGSLAKRYKCNSGTIYYYLKQWKVQIREKQTKKGEVNRYDEQIRKLYQLGYSAYKISKELGVSKPSILRHGKFMGLDFSNKSTWKNPIRLKDIKEEIINLYNSGISTNKIADQTRYSSSNIWKLLQKEGIDTSHEYYNVDLDFFKEINNYDKSYILGMWYADGNVRPDQIRLQLADKELIEYTRRCLNYEGPIREIKPRIEGRKIQYSVAVARQELVNQLIEKGCPPNKSLILQFPSNNIVPNHLIDHFLLGWFDGDGNIYYYKKQNKWKIQLVGTREFLEGVKKNINVNGYWNQRHPEHNNNCWNFTIGEQLEIMKFLEFIYKNHQFCLQRKKLKAEECLLDLRSRNNK